MRFLYSIGFILITASSHTTAGETISLSDQQDRINYSIGVQIGEDFKRQQVNLHQQAIQQGLADGQQNSAPLVDIKEMNTALTELKKNITSSMKQEAEEKIRNRKLIEQQKRDAGNEFMALNQTREGVKTLPNGLQYKIITSGSGPTPGINDYVTFHYRAKTLDGKEYDSSYKKGKPATYRANAVLPGFTEAIQMMQPGAKWELYLPPEQAYGRQGPLAHQTIILETELLSIGQ